MKTRSTRTLLAAFAAASTLALSSCGALVGIGSGPGAPSSAPTAQGETENPSVSDVEGRTSTAVGTEGMEPLGTIGETVQSSAMGIEVDTATDPAWAAFYEQKAEWGDCENPAYSQAQCATISVPLKWNEPGGEKIDLLLTKIAATGEKKGSILMNPGGPGGSGAQHVAEYAALTTTDKLRASYDLIGFDPRGVKDSTGIQCLSDKETDEYLSFTADPEASDAEAKAALDEWSDKVSKACAANSGELLQHLDTYSAARDMDVIRAAVGSDKLDYLGYSYGTYLGASYAELYPQRTGHLVLDGAIDPSLTADEMSAGQAHGFNKAVTAFATWCLEERGTCPLAGTPEEGVQQIRDFLDTVAEKPIPTSGGRDLTGALASTGVLSSLYNDQTWEFLAIGIEQAQDGDGALLLMLADLMSERNEDGTYASNSTYAIRAINCLDHVGVTDEKWEEREAERLATEYPPFGDYVAYAGLACKNWPAKPVRAPAPITAEGAAPILVIGTTGDPATPYEWAEALAEQLSSGILLTFDGEGHTAYGRSGGCIEEAVDAFFLEDKTPADGTVCGL